MTMTKAEQAAFAALQKENAHLKALCETRGVAQPVARDLKAPTGDGHTQGYDFNLSRFLSSGSMSYAVYPAWSEARRHGEGCTRHDFGSRDPLDLYSTEARALQGLRYELDVFYASKAAAIDAALAAKAPAKSAGRVELAQPEGPKLTHRHVAFALSVTRFDTPVSSSPKTADALIAAGYLRVAKGLYKLTVSGKAWLASRQT